MRAHFFLLFCHLFHHMKAAFPEFLLQLFLSCRIDPFSDNQEVSVQKDLLALSLGSEHGRMPVVRRKYRQVFHCLCQPADMLRRCSAAAAEKPRPGFNERRSPGSELFRIHRIDRLAVHKLRQTRIWLYHDRHFRIFFHFAYHRKHLLRPGGTIDADHISADTLKHHHRRHRVRSVQGSAVLLERHGRHHRQIAGFPDGDDGRSGLRQTHHCLHHKKIHAGLIKVSGLFFININEHQ